MKDLATLVKEFKTIIDNSKMLSFLVALV